MRAVDDSWQDRRIVVLLQGRPWSNVSDKGCAAGPVGVMEMRVLSATVLMLACDGCGLSVVPNCSPAGSRRVNDGISGCSRR